MSCRPKSSPNRKLETALATKADAAHTHIASNITNFSEAVQDAVAAALVAGSGQQIIYDDENNTLTFVNSAPLTTEGVQDIVGAMVEAGSNVSASYDDTTGKLTISTTGDGTGFTQEQIEDIVAALLVAGSNVTLNYNDATGQLEIVAAGGTSDADTLEGLPGEYYLNADNHTDGTSNKSTRRPSKPNSRGLQRAQRPTQRRATPKWSQEPKIPSLSPGTGQACC